VIISKILESLDLINLIVFEVVWVCIQYTYVYTVLCTRYNSNSLLYIAPFKLAGGASYHTE
jgi:hypothetical protein